jgi:deoxycytidylate deaminase
VLAERLAEQAGMRLSELMDEHVGEAGERDGQLNDVLNQFIENLPGHLRDGGIKDLTEFGRSVHAEMSAVLDAARRGVPIGGCTLYTTTFPCHNCARHLIGAGIRRVVFIEPYEKSRAEDLHEESVTIDK